MASVARSDAFTLKLRNESEQASEGFAKPARTRPGIPRPDLFESGPRGASLLFLDKVFLRPRKQNLRGVELFNLTLIQDLARDGFALTIPIHYSWKDDFRHAPSSPSLVFREISGRVTLWNGLLAAWRSRRQAYHKIILANIANSLIPALWLLRIFNRALPLIVFAHRMPSARFMAALPKKTTRVICVNGIIAAEFKKSGFGDVQVLFGHMAADRFHPDEETNQKHRSSPLADGGEPTRDKVKHPAAASSAEVDMATKAESRGATCSAGVVLATQVESLRNPAKPGTPFFPVASLPAEGGAQGDQGHRAFWRRRVNFCVVGFLDNAWKGADTALAAFRAMPQDISAKCALHLASYRSPPSFPEKNIRAYNWLPTGEMPEWMRRMDVMIVPSRDEQVMRETFSLTMIEGMLTGLPIIASNLPILAEKLDAGGGYVFKSTEELSRMMAELASKPELCAELGEKARRIALARYVWNTAKFVGRYLGV